MGFVGMAFGTVAVSNNLLSGGAGTCPGMEETNGRHSGQTSSGGSRSNASISNYEETTVSSQLEQRDAVPAVFEADLITHLLCCGTSSCSSSNEDFAT